MMRWIVPCTLFTALILTANAHAVFPPTVKDDGKFFTKEGLEKANKKIRQIYETYKKDVIVETLGQLTDDQMKKQKEDGDVRFFNKLSNDRAKELGLNGVYIVISKKPRYLRLHMDPETQKKAFTVSNRTAAFKKIAAQFADDKFDEGLLEGLNEIEAALKANAATK